MTQTILDFVASHPFAAFALVFFVSLGEALFIVGLFVPSTFVLIAVGALVGAGKLPFLPVLILASAGAIVGDALSFWVGHHFKGRLRSVWPFRRYAALLDKGEAFFQRHGGKSIFIGRFVPGVKAIVPGIAGMVGMDFTRFSVVNTTSAVVWAAAHLVPAAGLGLSLSRIQTFDPRLAVLGIIALGLVLVVYYLAKIAYGFAYPLFDRWRLERVSSRAVEQSRLAGFETRILTNDRAIVGWTLVLLVAALAAGGFLTLLTDLLFDPQLKLVDKAVYNVLQSLRSEAGTRVMTALTMGAGGAVLTPLTLALLAVLLFRRRFVLAIMTGVAVGAQSVFVPLDQGHHRTPAPDGALFRRFVLLVPKRPRHPVDDGVRRPGGHRRRQPLPAMASPGVRRGHHRGADGCLHAPLSRSPLAQRRLCRPLLRTGPHRDLRLRQPPAGQGGRATFPGGRPRPGLRDRLRRPSLPGLRSLGRQLRADP